MPGFFENALSVPRAGRFAAAAVVWALAGCSALPSLPSLDFLPTVRDRDTFLGVITPYRMDIVQGNVVTKEQAEIVKPGMSREQVRNVLGSPMLADMFHADRWDYTFTIRRQGTEPQRRSVVAYFKDDKLERLEAPELPTEQEFVASISRAPKSDKVPVLELTPAQLEALPKPAATSTPPVSAPLGAVREYPPLEPT